MVSGDIKAWLITGSRVWADAVTKTEEAADVRIIDRNSDLDEKIPLVAADDLQQARKLLDEMAEALCAISKGAHVTLHGQVVVSKEELNAATNAFAKYGDYKGSVPRW